MAAQSAQQRAIEQREQILRGLPFGRLLEPGLHMKQEHFVKLLPDGSTFLRRGQLFEAGPPLLRQRQGSLAEFLTLLRIVIGSMLSRRLGAGGEKAHVVSEAAELRHVVPGQFALLQFSRPAVGDQRGHAQTEHQQRGRRPAQDRPVSPAPAPGAGRQTFAVGGHRLAGQVALEVLGQLQGGRVAILLRLAMALRQTASSARGTSRRTWRGGGGGTVRAISTISE